MLDNETKRRIDTARDILVGKVPDPKSQVEQITIALIYKFMDDMDMEAEELGGERNFFKGEFERYAWRKIFDRSIGGFEMLNLYSEAIIKMNHNPQIPQLFRDIFKNAYLPYRDPETLKSFLKVINDFTYDHSEKLGDAFEYLLSVLGSQGDAGQFRTPRHIIDFMVTIIDPQKHETILDPACGTAGFLISAYKHILKNNSTNYDPVNDPAAFEVKDVRLEELGAVNGKKYKGDKLLPEERTRLVSNIRGYDISPDMVRLSLVNLYLHGFVSPNIFEYDTLTSEERWNEYADVILANPPFMSPKGGIRPHKRFSVTSSRSEVLFVDYMAEHLTPTGKAAIIVPEGIIFQSGTAYKTLRKMLVDENYLVGVISLPAGVFNPYAGVKTSILWLDRSLAKRTDNILFVKIGNDGFDLGAQRRPIKQNDMPEAFRNIVRYKESLLTGEPFDADQFPGFTVAEKTKVAASEDFNLNRERYIDKKIVTTDFPIVMLKEVAEVISGQSPEGQYYNEDGIGLPFYQGKTEFTDYNIGSPVKWTTQTTKEAEIGDILMSVRAPVGPVNFATQRICIGRGLAAIRVNSNINSKFLFQLLKSIEKNIKGGGGSVFDSISRNQIEEIQIPLPPLSIQQEIAEEIEGYQKIIDGARQVVENWKPRIDIDPEWPMVELGGIININNGQVLTEFDEAGDLACIKVSDMNLLENLQEIVTSSHWIKKNDKKYLPIDSIIFPKRGAAIATNKKRITKVPCIIDNNCMGITITNKDLLLPKFLLIFLWNFDLSSISNSAGIPLINNGDITGVKVPLPDVTTQELIIEMIETEIDIINASKRLIAIFEQKIKDRIARVWGES
jgi:type I restriction enzyme M protein